jgi:hypothetical protein
MAIDFPDSPSVDQQYTVGERTWTWNGTYWAFSINATFTASDSAPADPALSDMWYETSTGKLFIRYDGFWVEVGAADTYRELIADTDGDTSVQVEYSSDEDVVRFITAGTERANISASGMNVASSLSVDGAGVATTGKAIAMAMVFGG